MRIYFYFIGYLFISLKDMSMICFDTQSRPNRVIYGVEERLKEACPDRISISPSVSIQLVERTPIPGIIRDDSEYRWRELQPHLEMFLNQ